MEKDEQELRRYLLKRIEDYCCGKACTDCDVQETCFISGPVSELPTRKILELYYMMYPGMKPKTFDQKDEQIIDEQLQCIAENLSRDVSNRMTREEMIKALEEYCSARSFCTDCPLKKFKKGVSSCKNYFSEMPDKELAERMDLIEKEKDTSQEAVKGIIKRLSSLTAKADAGKAPISLVPMEIVWAIAWIRKYGNEKYGDPDNWKTVEPERYRDALMRHLLHYISDPKSVDEESGYPHLWHAACNMAFLMNMDYGGMCHYDFAVKKPEWEKIGKAVENNRISPSEQMHELNERLGKEISKVINETD